MRYVLIREAATVIPGLHMTPGTLVYVARLRKDVALSAALLNKEPIICYATDPRVEWAKSAGKCQKSCAPLTTNDWLSIIPCTCEVMIRARLMLREIDRKEQT